MLGKLAVLLLVGIVVVHSAKQCSEKKPKKNLNLVTTKHQQLTGKALVEHINKLGGWKVSSFVVSSFGGQNNFYSMSTVLGHIQQELCARQAQRAEALSWR